MATKVTKMSLPHAAGIYADMSVDGPAIGTLVAVFDRAKNLPNRKTMGKQNPYCAARLGKEAKKTDTDFRGGQTPRWDQELRFTVHESPDYQRLKVSVFNDDKKTDLIGETWIDLSKLIIPGGGQSDQWHSLQFKGKYAGEVRIEMTYYDSRPEDEAVIEKRKEKAQAKNNTSGTGSSLSGPRQPRQMKRRPLPEDPTGGASRAAAQEASAASSSLSTNQRQESVDQMKTTSRHAEPSAHSSHSSRHHEQPREYPRSQSKHSYPDPRSGYPDQHGGSYNRPHQEHHSHNREYYDHHYEHHRHRSSRDAYDYPPPEQDAYYRQNPPPDQYREPVDHGRYHEEPMSYSHHVRHPVQPNGYAPPPNHAQVPIEQETVPYPRQEMVMQGPPRQPSEHEKPPYAAMQPTVEDEPDEGPPPPPPVHRSSASNISRPPMGQTSYRLPAQEYIPMPDPRNYHAPMPAVDMAPAQPGPIPAPANPNVHMNHYPQHPVPQNAMDSHGYNASMPPVEASAAQPVTMPPTNQSVNAVQYPPAHSVPQNSAAYPAPVDPRTPERQSGRVAQGPPQNMSYDQRMESNPAGVNDREVHRMPSATNLGQFSVRRKSVGGQPPTADEQTINSPFSPDSYDILNPRASPSAARDAPPYHDRFGRDARLTPPNDDHHYHHSRDDGPIIGDDGREIDPSDHLPSETWAPEPERKTKKPEVKIRFKHTPQNNRSSTHQAQPPTPDSTGRARQRVHFRPQAYTPPRDDPYNNMPPRYSPPAYSPGSQQHQPPPPPQQQQRPKSPTPSSKRRSLSPGVSSLYSLEHVGPPIPAKVPIQAPSSGPMDALSQEIQSIDLGSSRRGGGQGYTR